MDIRTKSLEVGFDKAYEYLDRNPEENLPKLLAMVRKMMPDKEYESKFMAKGNPIYRGVWQI